VQSAPSRQLRHTFNTDTDIMSAGSSFHTPANAIQHAQVNSQLQASSTLNMTVRSRPIGTQQNPNARFLSGQSTLPAPFPGRAPLGHQHITNSQMRGMINSFGSLSTDQNATYDNILTNAFNNLNPNSTTGQRSCIQSRYEFACGSIYAHPLCTCCPPPSSLALPGAMQFENSYFKVFCADCSSLTLDLRLECAKQDA